MFRRTPSRPLEGSLGSYLRRLAAPLAILAAAWLFWFLTVTQRSAPPPDNTSKIRPRPLLSLVNTPGPATVLLPAGSCELTSCAAALPAGVDASSRLETDPGRKDHQRLRAFVAAALAAFDGLHG